MMEAAPVCDVVVVGAGVSGLSLGYFLRKKGLNVQVHEAEAEPGGNIRTVRHDGFLYDVGPDSFVRTKPDAEQLCRELGLGESLIEPLPEGRKVFVAYDGRLHPMPEGLSLGVPTHPLALLESSLLSGVGKLRTLCEPFVLPPESFADDESIQHFLVRRLGREMAERVAAPLLSGVFAGDAERLSIRAAFPQIPALERSHGSLFFGMKAARKQPTAGVMAKAKLLLQALVARREAAPSPFFSLRAGMGELVGRLLAECGVAGRDEGGVVHLNSPVRRLLTLEGRVCGVVLRSGREVRARAVVIAGPPWAQAEVVGLTEPKLRKALLEAKGAPTATVLFGLRGDQMDVAWQGSGFIVPRGEGEILASTFTHQKWEGRAPRGFALLRAFIGGARAVGPDVRSASDDELVAVSRRELERFLGALGPAVFTRVYRYARGTPQPELGHASWVRRVRTLEAAVPGLHLIGPGYEGVGIPDCVRAARKLGEELG